MYNDDQLRQPGPHTRSYTPKSSIEFSFLSRKIQAWLRVRQLSALRGELSRRLSQWHSGLPRSYLISTAASGSPRCTSSGVAVLPSPTTATARWLTGPASPFGSWVLCNKSPLESRSACGTAQRITAQRSRTAQRNLQPDPHAVQARGAQRLALYGRVEWHGCGHREPDGRAGMGAGWSSKPRL